MDGEGTNLWKYHDISPYISKATSWSDLGFIWTHMTLLEWSSRLFKRIVLDHFIFVSFYDLL